MTETWDLIEYDPGHDPTEDDVEDEVWRSSGEYSGLLEYEEYPEIIEFEYTTNYNIAKVIEKVRNVARMFRLSPTRTDSALTPNVLKAHGKDLRFISDCKTRWNSTAEMLIRFLKLYKSNVIRHALIDLGPSVKDMDFTADEITILEEIVEVLNPVKQTLTFLCTRGTNLLQVDSAATFLIQQLKARGTALANEFASALIKRFVERRTMASSVLQLLHNNNSNTLCKEFIPATQANAIAFMKDLLERVENNDSTIEAPVPVPTNENVSPNFSEAMLAIIEKDCMEAERDAEMGSLSDQITKKLLLFNAGGVQMRGPLLSKVYKWLIQVTSVERNFSQVEPICNKLRTRLSDRSICDLSMFKTYFKNE